MIKLGPILLFSVYIFLIHNNTSLFAQQAYGGYIFDSENSQPLGGASIKVSGITGSFITNKQGFFSISSSIIDSFLQSNNKLILTYNQNRLSWISSSAIDASLFDIKGRKILNSGTPPTSHGEYIFPTLSSGVYLLKLSSSLSEKVVKVFAVDGKILLNYQNLSLTESIKISLSLKGYNEDDFLLHQGIGNSYYLTRNETLPGNFVNSIPNESVFMAYEGEPLNDTYNGVTSVKFVYDIPSGTIYYMNSTKYLYHYNFARSVMNYNKDLYFFNKEQYSENPQRIYYLGAINHYLSSDIYTVEFFAGDELKCSEIQLLYTKIAQTCFFDQQFKFFPNTESWSKCTSIPRITPDELFQGQDFQALNKGIAYGYLKKTDWTKVSSSYLGRHDIALLNGIPNDVPVVSAIITTEFQTPLSHINILSKNRKTPNMALRSGWDNELFNSLVDKLVRLEVTSDYFSMREATLTEAQAYWDSHEPQQPQKLNLDTLTTGLIELSNAGYNSTKTIGGKASNFAEMQKMGSIPLPEAGFAIPFYYYRDHLKRNGIIPFMNQMFKDEDFRQNASIRDAWLERLRDTIKHTPINPELLALVSQKMQQSGFPAFRLRSSTNAEDIEGFNGAGLYDSYTAIPGDADKTIEKAIKKVWASLWNFRAFEEREYFKIDHNSTAMGFLVNRSFPTEDANGVVITTNLYNPDLPAYVINVQFLEYSVVRPEDNVLPEQIIFYQMEQPYANRIEYINRSTLPGKGNEYVLSADEVTKLAGLCQQISVHYCNLLGKCIPLDIEFKVDSTVSGIRKLYIKQVRPFTR